MDRKEEVRRYGKEVVEEMDCRADRLAWERANWRNSEWSCLHEEAEEAQPSPEPRLPTWEELCKEMGVKPR
jgi:hypothetical protein